MTDELKSKIEASRRECLKKFDEQTEKIAETIAMQVAEDAENAGVKGVSLDEAIKALEEAD